MQKYNCPMPKIYISAMETLIQGKPVFNAKAGELLKLLKEAGFELYWEKEFRAYKQIEKEIAQSNALLAIVDETWRSSTWMASEVTWANGDSGAIHTSNQRMKPIPIFLYPVLEKKKWGWLNDYSGPIVLDNNIQKAVENIKGILL